MARLPRIDLPGFPQHIMQRGNNRLPCFLDDGDRLRYLHLMHDALHATGCQLHAYVLMDNHVHLLVTPPYTGRIGQLMQRLGRNYVALFNGRHRRTGTLWEGRYKACLVDSADYVLRCYRYIELNPVRARLTDNPAAYRWSSCPANLGQRRYSALTPHPCWLALGSDPIERSNAYRALLDEALCPTNCSPASAFICNSSAPWATTASARWSKPRPAALRASGPRIGHASRAPPIDK
ncbi:transposase [Xanthomonas axonopodis]|uniref:transposase n=1 Tax=Xanthomonas axonopodis TaxID=53413 RepID=UPI0031B58288